MRKLVEQTNYKDNENGTNFVLSYKGEVLPYLDLQMLAITALFGFGFYLILNFYSPAQKKKNIITTLLATLLFLILFWWISLPEMIFYNLLRL
jgi:hypothetical protein